MRDRDCEAFEEECSVCYFSGLILCNRILRRLMKKKNSPTLNKKVHGRAAGPSEFVHFLPESDCVHNEN